MHDHSHDTDTYYLDQLCMVGITGAFAGICLTLYFFNSTMLNLLLTSDFHPLILAAGITLLIVTLVRAAVLWQAAGKQSAAHAHDHDHAANDHHHDHAGHDHHHHHEHGEHGAHDHDHHVHDEKCGHNHHHHEHVQPAVAAYHSPTLPMVTHDHHGHDHGADDGHDHGWAPWRYVVLLVPMMLFLLGLPGKAMPLTDPSKIELTEDWARESSQAARLVGLQQTPLAQAVFAATLTIDADTTTPVEFKQLEQFAFNPLMRQTWKDKKVQVTGQFVPYPGNDRVFFLSRLRIQCCGADAIQLNVPIYCRESLKDFKKEDWVRVTGRIEFREQTNRPGIYTTVLVVNRKEEIVKTNPDPRPYIN